MKPVPTEDQECKVFVEYLELLQGQGLDIIFTHLANETYTKSYKQKNRNKAMGVRGGFPDYVLIINGYFIVIEMKRQKGGRLQETQKEWINKLMRAEISVYVCFGFDDAKNVVDTYLTGGNGVSKG